MKTKPQAKWQAILEQTADVFRKLGFGRASMPEICARVGGSQATRYNYWPILALNGGFLLRVPSRLTRAATRSDLPQSMVCRHLARRTARR